MQTELCSIDDVVQPLSICSDGLVTTNFQVGENYQWYV